jgi:signal transduction histidine kinase
VPFDAAAEDPRGSVASVASTPLQRRISHAAMGGILASFAVLYPFALLPLPRTDGFVPSVQALISATDLITALLLYGQFAVSRSRALLVLASGYLFCALIVLAHTLTFPGAFWPTGLLGAGPQTAAWLYFFWHLGFPAAVIAYALLKGGAGASATGRGTDREALPALPATEIVSSAGVVIAIVVALTAGTIVGADYLPRVVLGERTFASLASAVVALDLLASLVAFALLWRRRHSILDDWLMVAVCAAIAEAALVTFAGASRYTLAFYSARSLAFVVSSSVLAALMWEMTRLYARLAIAYRALQRERANKLLNLEVMIGSVAHEIKQPLTVIAARSGVVQRLLRQPIVDVDKARENLGEMERASFRVVETFENIRALFRNPNEAPQPIDVNEVALATLQLLDVELRGHRISVDTGLSRDLPAVAGHRGQLQEVLVNIVQNAIDAMDEVDRARTLKVTTARRDGNQILVAVEDTGCGIDPRRLPNLFDAFTTTKERGTGLGLGICRMIVDHHNGQLAASSELGKGARFEITLPSIPRPAAAPAAAPATLVKAEA